MFLLCRTSRNLAGIQNFVYSNHECCLPSSLPSENTSFCLVSKGSKVYSLSSGDLERVFCITKLFNPQCDEGRDIAIKKPTLNVPLTPFEP